MARGKTCVMKKIYILSSLCLLSLLVASCSKDVLKSYDKRIIGTWRLHDIDKYGFGRSNNLPFREDGIFTFSEDGQLVYSSGGNIYKGSWDIRRQYGDDEDVKSLHITVVDFVNQVVLSEFFNKIRFTATNRFNAQIDDNVRTYVFRFSRQ